MEKTSNEGGASLISALDLAIYLGPNLFVPYAAIRHRLTLGSSLAELREEAALCVIDRLTAHIGHSGTYQAGAPLSLELKDVECPWPHLVAQLALLFQEQATGAPLRRFRIEKSAADGMWDVCYDYEDAIVGLAAGILAMALLNDVLSETYAGQFERGDFDFTEAYGAFRQLAQLEALAYSPAVMFREARRRNIPAFIVSEMEVQLGQGCRQKRILASNVGINALEAIAMATDKVLTARLLRAQGLAVPEHIPIKTVKQALTAAERIGGPVVVKPVTGDEGNAVTIQPKGSDEIRYAIKKALEHGLEAIVESFVPGEDYRLLVLDGKMIAATKRISARVVGDGRSSIRALVDELNRDPRRGRAHQSALTLVEVDDEVIRHLARKGRTPETVPDAGQMITLRALPNLSAGGTSIDKTDDVHPENRDLAVCAVETMGLRLGGVDLVMPDIARSYRKVGGKVCEVNGIPGLRLHMSPSEGTARDVARPMLEAICPQSESTRIPIAAITGTNGKTTTTRMVGHIARLAGMTVGLTTTHGAFVGAEQLSEGDVAGAPAAIDVLSDPRVEIAVLETARGGLIQSGLGFDRCAVGAVLNVADDHIGLDGVDTLADMARLKQIIVKAADDAVILNADDPHCMAMAPASRARYLAYVTMVPENAAVDAHIREGGRAVRLETQDGADIAVLYVSGVLQLALPISELPSTLGGRARHNIQNAMFAAGIAHSLGISPETIARGLREFDCSFALSPGRMNFYEGLPFRVLMDWAHNEPGLRAAIETIHDIPVNGRRICLLTAGGNRTDRQVIDMARAMAGRFDHFVFCNRDDPRGRGPEDIPKLLRQGVVDKGVADSDIRLISDEEQAVDAALKMARRGDFLVLFAYDYQRAWSQIESYARELAATDSSGAMRDRS